MDPQANQVSNTESNDLEDDREPVEMDTSDRSDNGLDPDTNPDQTRAEDPETSPRSEKSSDRQHHRRRRSSSHSRNDQARSPDSRDLPSRYKQTDSRSKDYEHQRRPTIVQVLNISPEATLEQVKCLFSFLGDIVNIELYDSDERFETEFKVGFVEFARQSSVRMAQYLTNTVFIDRTLIVLTYNKLEIPDLDTAMESVAKYNVTTNFNPGVVSQIITTPAGAQVISTVDPKLITLGLPQYPNLPINTDPTRAEEIRRTLYIGNLDSTVPPDQVMKFFNDLGDVKYIRLAGDETQPTRFAFVEYTHQSELMHALFKNGSLLGSRSLKINHSNNSIVKPPPKVEIDEYSRRDRDRDRHHSSRYNRDRDRGRDRDRYRDRYVSPRRDRRSRDRDVGSSRRRSRSRDHRRSRSRDKGSSRRRSRSRDTDRRRRRSRSKSSEHSSKSKQRRRRSRR